MKRLMLRLVPLSALLLCLVGHTTPTAGQSTDDTSEKKYEDFDKLTKGAKFYDGLFKLHQKDDNLFAEIRQDQLDKPFLCPIAIARGLGMGGHTLNFDEQWVIVFKRVNDRIQVIRRNVRFTAKPGSPAAKAVETTYTDSVLLALKIRSIHPVRQSLLINLNDMFMTDFADLGLGYLDVSRSSWFKVKAFPRNIEVEVAATFSGGRGFGGDSVIDHRGNTVVLHYGLCALPESGYTPRLADDRVGYFLSVQKDFSGDSQDTNFVRYVNRWRVERAEPVDPKNPNRLSPPKKKIVWWIEKSVPDEYRAAVREGILEWNKAFEKIGFRDVIEVRQQENEDFDPEDINYNTFRWIATDRGFAMGPSRANPLTGEILDADIIFDASMVRLWKQEAKLFQSDRPASLIQATREGYGLEDLPQLPGLHAQSARGENEPRGWNDAPKDPKAARERARTLASRNGLCQCGAQMRFELGLAAMALVAADPTGAAGKAPDDLVYQAVKHVTMHEVGHTLGLRHNFKASSMLPNDKLNDTKITREKGLVGSVMDYSPVNLAPKGVKQGDYFSQVLGPYDYWAIEYAYRPLSGGTEGEVEKLRDIARKGAEPGHDYATDEDMFGTSDPLVQTWDLGADPMKFGMDRITLAEGLMKNLSEHVVEKGEGYQRARTAFDVLLMQYANGTYLVVSYVGGEYAHRDHRDDLHARDPFVPVPGDKQRQALKFVQEHILTDKTFQFSPALLRKLAAERWSHWGDESPSSVDYPLNERIMSIQRTALNHLFSGLILSRVQNLAAKTGTDDKPLQLDEIFRVVTDGVWADLNSPSSVVRRNLQREHVRKLTMLVLEGRGPADARSLARFHLREIDRKLDKALSDKEMKADDTTRAHFEECRERIAKVLTASIQVREP
jgi:hypothetical protein